MEDKKDVVRDIEERISIGSRTGRYLNLLIVIILIFGSLIYINGYIGGDSQISDDYASPNQANVHTTQDDADKKFIITKNGVSPASLQIKLGKPVGFKNNLSGAVTVSFDSSNKTVQIKPGESKSRLINAITYFEIKSEDVQAKGRINIQ